MYGVWVGYDQAGFPLVDEPFGSSQTFGNWSKGSIGVNVKTPPQVLANTANKYSALEIMETEKRPISSRPGSKEPYSSKGTSLERGYGKLYDGRGSRSGSQHRSNDSSASSSQRSTPAPVMPPAQPKPVQQAPVVQLTEEQIIRRINNSLDEYITGSCTADDYFLDISSILPPSYYPRIVSDSYSRVLEKSQQARLKTGGLFAKLIKSGKIPLEDYCTGLEEIFLQAEDLQIDVPKIWDYLAEILVNLVCEEVLPLSRLYKSFQPLIKQDRAVEVLVPLFKFVVTEVGPNFLQNIWQVSGLQLTDFMPASQIKSFIEDNQFGFLLGRGTPVGQNHLTYEQIQNKLSEFLKLSSPIDSIVNWITANIGDKVKENKFIRALATAVFESSINKNFKLVPKNIGWPTALIHKMEHPPGSFSQESFLAWENSNDPAEQEGKGVALKQLTSLFTQMKENDEEDYGSSTSEDA
ncbi:hypothetical protein NQ317_015052 [Molorchus minor]|uniref:MI domain-containing protein n=1 Tax=Molorchus minor TaxID=1323400 RepID=A0ABQ9K7B3_9CUCU|nr:hypothetical protein NQ317_015052 [Molorchus minor]